MAGERMVVHYNNADGTFQPHLSNRSELQSSLRPQALGWPVHAWLASTQQPDEQPSPPSVLPSSLSSPGSMISSPHTVRASKVNPSPDAGRTCLFACTQCDNRRATKTTAYLDMPWSSLIDSSRSTARAWASDTAQVHVRRTAGVTRLYSDNVPLYLFHCTIAWKTQL